jgi:hypothetical protein
VIQSEESPHFFAHDTQELGLGPKWAEEYVEQRIDTNADKSNIRDEDPDVTYSKFMKFMRQEGDIPIESGQRTTASLDDTVEEWIEQFHSDKQKTDDNTSDHAILNKVEDQLTVAGTWMDEFIKDTGIHLVFFSKSITLYLYVNKIQQDYFDKITAIFVIMHHINIEHLFFIHLICHSYL